MKGRANWSTSDKSLINILNNNGPSKDPSGILLVTSFKVEAIMSLFFK